MKIIWNEDWSLGIKEIDDQHKNLVEILNKIITRQGSSLEHLKNLISYVGDHFITEEIMMMRNNYSTEKILKHKQEHDFLRKNLLEFSFKLVFINSEGLNEEPVLRLIEDFTTRWFRYHFLETDKAVADWLKEVQTKEK